MMATKNSEWMNRAARRKNLEQSMYKTQTRRGSTKDSESVSTPPSSMRKGSESIHTRSRKGSECVHTPTRSFSINSAASANISSSPSGSLNSTAASSLSNNLECEDQLQSLLRKLRANTAEIDANEAQMRSLTVMDEQVSAGISQRLKDVQGLNQRLNDLSRMLARVEDLSRGNS